MRNITEIILHCSATTPSMDIGAEEIRRWHVNGNGWSDIGYHGVIRRDGTLESGRPMDQIGAHAKGHNVNSIGICLVGGICGGAACEHEHETFASGQKGTPENNYTPAQWNALERAVRDLLQKFPKATVHGHNEFAAKACPCFDVRAWFAENFGG